MYRSLAELIGYKVRSSDGIAGKIKDFYFRDTDWKVNYLIVDTNTWLPGRKVLVSPSVVEEADFPEQTIDISITKEAIENSPPISMDEPVSVQKEKELSEHYSWPFLMSDPMSGYATAKIIEEEKKRERKSKGQSEEPDNILRSVSEILGYSVNSADEKFGEIEDFIIDFENWNIKALVVFTGNWLAGKTVLLKPNAVKDIKWKQSTVETELHSDEIRNGPAFDPFAAVNAELKVQLYDYHGRPIPDKW